MHKTGKLRVYASNEPRIGIVKTAMGACAQIAVFTYAVMRRTPRYEIRLAAFFADNLMNSVAHCGCDESQQPALGQLIFEKSLNIVKIVKNKLLRKRFLLNRSFYTIIVKNNVFLRRKFYFSQLFRMF